jgi:hypothetical protein
MQDIPTSITQYVAPLPDPRAEHTTRHRLLDMVPIALCAGICGADDFVGMVTFAEAKEAWLRTFLPLPGGVPCHDTVGRAFAALDPEALQACFLAWVQAMVPSTAKHVVAIAGKTRCGAPARGRGQAAVHLVSAWASGSRLVLGHRPEIRYCLSRGLIGEKGGVLLLLFGRVKGLLLGDERPGEMEQRAGGRAAGDDLQLARGHESVRERRDERVMLCSAAGGHGQRRAQARIAGLADAAPAAHTAARLARHRGQPRIRCRGGGVGAAGAVARGDQQPGSSQHANPRRTGQRGHRRGPGTVLQDGHNLPFQPVDAPIPIGNHRLKVLSDARDHHGPLQQGMALVARLLAQRDQRVARQQTLPDLVEDRRLRRAGRGLGQPSCRSWPAATAPWHNDGPAGG